MKLLLSLTIVILINFSNCRSQTKVISYSVEFFLLGSLPDYFGWAFPRGEQELIYWFQGTDLYNLYRFDSLLKEYNYSTKHKIQYDIELCDSIVDEKSTTFWYCFKSKQLFKFFKKYYVFTFYPKMYVENFWDKYGKLRYRPIKRKNDLQIKSFLAGAFFVYGSIERNHYYIRIGNTRTKAKVIYRLLKYYKCYGIEYVKHTNGRPNIDEITFTPSKKLKEIFDYEDNMRKKLKKRDFSKYFEQFN
ncbi:MAG: hypothetical protein K9H64_21510 [Bacteroidales bacterium]|nr:hypothetical protein [Bacteroidales bacterium]MCF8458619.1 hypothetical protein [Bacteroidales bacterium]